MMRVIVTCGISDRERVTGMHPRLNQRLKYELEAVLFMSRHVPVQDVSPSSYFNFIQHPSFRPQVIGFHVWCVNER